MGNFLNFVQDEEPEKESFLDQVERSTKPIQVESDIRGDY